MTVSSQAIRVCNANTVPPPGVALSINIPPAPDDWSFYPWGDLAFVHGGQTGLVIEDFGDFSFPDGIDGSLMADLEFTYQSASALSSVVTWTIGQTMDIWLSVVVFESTQFSVRGNDQVNEAYGAVWGGFLSFGGSGGGIATPIRYYPGGSTDPLGGSLPLSLMGNGSLVWPEHITSLPPGNYRVMVGLNEQIPGLMDLSVIGIEITNFQALGIGRASSSMVSNALSAARNPYAQPGVTPSSRFTLGNPCKGLLAP